MGRFCGALRFIVVETVVNYGTKKFLASKIQPEGVMQKGGGRGLPCLEQLESRPAIKYRLKWSHRLFRTWKSYIHII